MRWRKGGIHIAYAPYHSDEHQGPGCAFFHQSWTLQPAGLPLEFQLLQLEQFFWPWQSSWTWKPCLCPGKILLDSHNDDNHLLIDLYYYALWNVINQSPTWSGEFVELRMIHYNSSQIQFRCTKNLSSPIQIYSISRSNIPVLEYNRQGLVFQTYSTRSVAFIAFAWSQWSQLFVIRRQPSKWNPRRGLISDSFVIVQEAPCERLFISVYYYVL